ncbi:MAG: SUF system NifU family Fe-S cluster assembly protein [Chloroflexi bacterium]|nr:SUF system NifU family Fe-S cluster assembly protein [Chloroflexota bacterium]
MDSLDELYRDIVLDHHRSPRNSECLESPDAQGEAINPFCGDEVRIQLSVADGRIDGVSISGVGCSISQASASLMGEAVKGKNLPEALAVLEAFRALMQGRFRSGDGAVKEIDLGDLMALEGVKRYPVRIKCSLLGWTALEDAIKDLGAG